ncbi:MAG: glucosaminidase domain-containing protein [bacterium]
MRTWKIVLASPLLALTLAFTLVPSTKDVFFISERMIAEFQSSNVAEKDNPPELITVTDVSAYHPSSVALGKADQYTPPDFSQIATSRRKEAFYDYLLPMVHNANSEVILERRWLMAMGEKLLRQQLLTAGQLQELIRFERRYKILAGDEEPAYRIGALLLRVDVVPASLIVAQAAKESGWGRSRFATEGNNFFGIWCFYRGCGLKPLKREEGRGHEVATFDTVEQGVRYYVRTINTHVAYDDLRDMRAVARKQQQSSLGEHLANGLIRYSERGMPYVREVQSMIRYNNLHRFTRIYSV